MAGKGIEYTLLGIRTAFAKGMLTMSANRVSGDFGPNFVPGKVAADKSAVSHAMSRPWGAVLTEHLKTKPAKHDAHTDDSVPPTDHNA